MWIWIWMCISNINLRKGGLAPTLLHPHVCMCPWHRTLKNVSMYTFCSYVHERNFYGRDKSNKIWLYCLFRNAVTECFEKINLLGTSYCTTILHSQIFIKIISYNIMFTKFRSNHRRCSIEKCALETFAKFTEKHLCHSFFFDKVAGLRPGTLLKRDSGTDAFLWILLNNLAQLFYRTFREDWFWKFWNDENSFERVHIFEVFCFDSNADFLKTYIHL